MKHSSDTIGNRTRKLLACSAVPQPTAPPRTHLHLVPKLKKKYSYNSTPRLGLHGLLWGKTLPLPLSLPLPLPLPLPC